MKLTRFVGEAVHGYLKFNFKFHSELTFLTGMNGSGKTTVLNSIIALITPSLSTLAELDYELIRVEFEHEGKNNFVQAHNDGTYVTLTCSNESAGFMYAILKLDGDMPPSKESEYSANYYGEITSENASNAVLRFASGLPTPMFLGLDRRARFSEDSYRYRYTAGRPAGRATKNVFSASLSRSLVDASALAERQYRDALIAAGRIGEELQREMLLRLLSVEPASGYGPLSRPTKEDIQNISAVRRDIEVLPQILNLPRREVRSKIVPFLDLLQGYINTIEKYSPTGKRNNFEPDDQAYEALFNWTVNSQQLKRIRVVSELVTTYNSRRQALLESTSKYLDLVNGFLKDSGKTVTFDQSGYISVKIDGIEGHKSISSLSSGEAQIFVIITQLAFNPAAQVANVFIIDEPELSLHVQWQEIFVDSIRSANPTIQYVMATHSPSIILERTKNCVDISRKRNQRGLRG